MTVQFPVARRNGAVSQNDSWLTLADELGQRFAARAPEADAADRFVTENVAELKTARAYAMAVPADFGGGGADYAQLAGFLRVLGRHCSATALAFAMHSHQVAVPAWRWRHQQAPVEGLLKRIATEQIVLLSTGGNDWIEGSGKAEPAEGGYRISGRKRFVSGVLAGDLLMTMARLEGPNGTEVLHMGIPMVAPGVRIEETWAAHGMRASGSHDVVLDNVFVAETGIALRRPAGKWHPLFDILSMQAFPLIYSVYLGVAEALRERVVTLAGGRRNDPDTQQMIGALDTQLHVARLIQADMVARGCGNQAGPAVTNAVFMGRGLMGEALGKIADLAMDAAGGGAFYRAAGIERLVRDLQAARYHPYTTLPQRRMAGRAALHVEPMV